MFRRGLLRQEGSKGSCYKHEIDSHTRTCREQAEQSTPQTTQADSPLPYDLPNFMNSGRYDGDIPASRWLTRLSYDFKKAHYNPPTPELFLEAIEMLLEGEPAKRLDSTPHNSDLLWDIWSRKFKDDDDNSDDDNDDDNNNNDDDKDNGKSDCDGERFLG